MFKKIAGACLVLLGFVSMMMAALNGTLFEDQGTVAETYGNLLGTVIGYALFIGGGCFLYNFDRATGWSFIDGFKKRSKQTGKIVPFIIGYGIISVATVSVGLWTVLEGDDSWISYILKCAIYIIPLLIFSSMLEMYAIPHNKSKKYFLKTEEALQYYLSGNEKFRVYSEDKFVLASDKAIYFPQLFCVIPINQIASVKLEKMLWEQNVYFYLTGGKKICITTKHYNEIINALKANTPAQQ